MADSEFADERRARLYGHVLLEALSGPWARTIKPEIGLEFTETCRVLYERHRERLMRNPVDLSVDDIDWAAVHALAPMMLRLYDDEFHATTGHDLEELRELGQQAVDMRREYRTPRQAVSYAIGECEVVLPTAHFEDRSYVVAVPDESSWNAVVPECARNRRDEFVVPLRSRMPQDCVWIELSVVSIEELEAWVDARRRRKPQPKTSGQPRSAADAKDGIDRGQT